MKENNKLLADFLELETTEFHGNLFLTNGILELESAAVYLKKHDHLKPCELLETPEEDNQQLNIIEI